MVVDVIFNAETCNPVVLFLSFVVFFLLVIYFSQNRSFPPNHGEQWIHFRKLPSPTAYPIFGHLISLGRLPHLQLTKWSETYGSLFRIKMGFMESLVISGNNTIKQALNSTAFAGRPKMETTKLISEGLSLTFSDFSSIWEHQKIAAKAAVSLYTTGRDPGKRSVMEASSFKHATILIEQLLQAAAGQNGIVNPRDYILTNASITICNVCFGKDFDLENPDLKRLLSINRSFDGAMAASQPVNFWPVLKSFPIINRAYKNLQVYAKAYWMFVASMLSSHWETYDENNMRDLVDCLYREAESERCNNNKQARPNQNILNFNPNQSTEVNLTSSNENKSMESYEELQVDHRSVIAPFSVVDDSAEQELKKRITYNVGDIFGAGYDTLFTMIHWAFLYLATFPETQDEIRKEIDREITNDEAPSFRLHGSKCPYTVAWIYELLRHSTASPMLVPHKTTRNVTLGNCFIPANTTVYFNIWQAHRDPKVWENPETFDPQRFLKTKENGALSLKQNCTTNLLSWGLGTRKCLGQELSKHQLFIFLTTIVKQVKLEQSIPGVEPVLPWPVTFGLTLKPKEFKLKVSKR